MSTLPNHTALKEWSSLIDALGRGDHVIVPRKGGIADPAFGVEADQFYLYPTFFHADGAGGEPAQVTIAHWAEVVETWRVTDPKVVEGVSAHLALPRETIESRLRFRPDQALHLLGLRVRTLPQPRTIAVRDDYEGCRSWISLEEPIDVEGSSTVLSADELRRKLDEVGRLVSGG